MHGGCLCLQDADGVLRAADCGATVPAQQPDLGTHTAHPAEFQLPAAQMRSLLLSAVRVVSGPRVDAMLSCATAGLCGGGGLCPGAVPHGAVHGRCSATRWQPKCA
jgi:hypothetical protein